jgi:hypothetical protein
MRSAFTGRALGAGLTAIILGCSLWYAYSPRSSLSPEHGHDPGQHGGIIVSVGPEHFHVEALFVAGELRLFTLGKDQSQIVDVPAQELTAYIRSPQLVESVPIALKPAARDGDPSGRTSAFAGPMPTELIGSEVIVVVPQLAIGRGRYRISFMAKAGSHDSTMPAKVSSDAEKQLYLTPGGKYTDADIVANGSQTASQKYSGFKSQHDFAPKAGDLMCPIEYQFCCPPCIDEFVKRAKTQADDIGLPTSYVKR